MIIFKLHKTQTLPIALDQAWEFFSNPANLNEITPPDLDMKIVGSPPDVMYPGMIIQYQVKPLPLMKVNWVTEITQVKAPYYFVDEQRFGPYAFWHHQHKFKEVEGGVLTEDIVHYGLHFCFLSPMINHLIIKNKLEHIFDYRCKYLSDKFS